MIATNHVITGALIAGTITTPVIALPLAVISHFALDALPHFSDNKRFALHKPAFTQLLLTDALLAASVLLLIFAAAPENWFIIAAGGVLAASPDLMWLSEYQRAIRHQKKPKRNRLARFHAKIQWSATPYGALVELAWLCMGLFLLFDVLSS